MSVTATVKVYVEGDTYDELLEKASELLSELLDIPTESVLDRANLELNIVENEPFESDLSYAAEVIARVKNVR
jgi:hypothetical protein